MKENNTCECCGAKTVKYKHNFNVGLFAGLLKLYNYGAPASLKDLNLTVNQFNNFQKLRYWKLVENEKNKWTISKHGIDFINQNIKIPKQVTTYRKETIDFSSKQISSCDFNIIYDKKDFYTKTSESIFKIEIK
jgi:hypothetical protein